MIILAAKYAEKYKKDFEELMKNSDRTNIKNLNTLPKYSNKVDKELVKYGPKIKRSSEKINKSANKLENRLYEDSLESSDDNSNKKVPVFITQADIEIFKKVKSNTALASAAVFLATGVLIAESKEEMKYVKTKLKIKDDGIEIKNPFSFHKFSDFRGFKVDKEDNYYLFYIIFSDEEMIHFRTKNKLLHEAILEKLELI